MKYKIVACVYICLLLASCNQVAETTWQEQYGLGVRFLSEGNYEEAIIAFEAAIKIDSQRLESYLYLSEVYVEIGDYEMALSVLKDGYKITNDSALYERLSVLQNDSFIRSETFQPTNLLNTSEKIVLSEILSLMESNDVESIVKRFRDPTWVKKFRGLDKSSGNTGYGEFRTICEGTKIELSWELGDAQNYSIEFRPYEGDAYYFSIFLGEAPYEVRHFCEGQSSGWNWNGDFTHTELTIMGNGTIQEVTSSGQVVDGLLDGEIFIEEYNDTYDVWTPEYYKMFHNGKIVFSQDEIHPEQFNMTYVYDQSGQKDYRSSTDNPDEWSEWVSSYRTGSNSSSGNENLLWD